MFRASTRCSVALVAASIGLASTARAEEPLTLSGTWSASGMREVWTTSEWGDACGPKPTGSGAPGGTVTVAQQGGELTISGAGRTYRTTECWEALPGLRRTSHSGGQRGWTSRCASAAGDPRRASISTNMTATDDTMVFQETGTFEFVIDGTTCRAAVGRSRSFKLLQRAGAPAATASAAPAPSESAPPPASATAPAPSAAPATGCAEPGPPTRLEVRPAKKLARPGETFALSVLALDAAGCRVPAEPRLTLEGAGASSLSVDGSRVRVAEGAEEGEATVQVVALGKTVPVIVEIVRPDRYRDLIAARGLNEAGEDDRAAVAVIEAGLGGGPTRATDGARQRKLTFLAIVGGLAGLLGLVGLAVWRRGRGARPDAARETEAPPAPNVELFSTGTTLLACPTCGATFAAGERGFCPDDGAALAAAPTGSVVPEPPPPSARPAGVDTICPTCGDRYPAGTSFCGKDGTQLVPLN